MGLRGNPPTPTPILAARGSWHAKVRKSEARPTIDLPDPPAHLDGEALHEWNRVAPELVTLGIAARVDMAAFASYCESWAEFVDCCIKLKTEPLVVNNRINPLVKIKNEAAHRILQFAGQFGLTPSARTRISAQVKPDDADPLAQMLAS